MKIKIAGEYYVYFNEVSVSTALDSVASVFAFTAKYDPSNAQQRALFSPLSYHLVQFYHDDDTTMSTGRIVSTNFSSTKNPELIRISGYSLGGVLEDCPIPYDLYPLESNNRSLKEITERLLKPFGLKLRVYDSAAKECGQIIEKSVAGAEESIKDYISKIAAQKNVIFSHDIYGGLIFFKPDVSGKSKGFFHKENMLDSSFDINGQGLHSHITTLRQPQKSDDETDSVAAVDSVKNPLVKAYRPTVVVQTSGTPTETAKGARNTMADELKNIRIGFSVPNDVRGLSIGDIIEIQNEELYVPVRTRFMVENTIISENSSGKTLAVTCVLPETFSGGQPKLIFG